MNEIKRITSSTLKTAPAHLKFAAAPAYGVSDDIEYSQKIREAQEPVNKLVSFDAPPIKEVVLGRTFLRRDDFLIPYYGAFQAFDQQWKLREE